MSRVTEATRESRKPARERVLEAASRLFYRHGYRAVGVDTIIAESGVAKMSLYRHFPSKNDLIAAYLERSNEQFWAWAEVPLSAHDDPRAALEALFDAVGKLATSPECLGCAFVGAAVEFPAPEHPGHGVAVAHKQAVIARLRVLSEAAGTHDPQTLAEALLLLMDGAWSAARVFGPNNHAGEVGRAARVLISAQLE